MPDLYETSDGKVFNTNAQASWHQEELDKSSSSRGGSSKPSQSAISRERATENLNQAARCANNGEYEKAIELCNDNMSYLYLGSVINMPENVLANAYNTRGHAYKQLGNIDQAIADFKKALDLDYKHEYAKKNLAIAEQAKANAEASDLAKQGLAAEQAKDYAKAVELYRKAADMGNAMAVCNLGVRYFTGQGIPKDINKAVELWRKSADMGYATAMNNLGVCYRDGTGVPKDETKAIEWFKKAAAQGHAGSQSELTKRGIKW
jgi:tetratricopeptide (TPR) repeat protein